MLKNCANELSLPVARLFSLCFRQQVQPRLWKVARVVPINKKKARSDLSNHRPVSLLCILSMTMETIVNPCIINFFSKHIVISSRQYGFRKALGTSDLLTILRNDWSSTAASGSVVHVLAIDIAGAFNKVSHREIVDQHAFLGKICRVGGKKLTSCSQSTKCPASEFKDQIWSNFFINVSTDDPQVHLQYLCVNCQSARQQDRQREAPLMPMLMHTRKLVVVSAILIGLVATTDKREASWSIHSSQGCLVDASYQQLSSV